MPSTDDSKGQAITQGDESADQLLEDDLSADPKEKLEHLKWDDLEQRYLDSIQKHAEEEEVLWTEFSGLVEVRFPWASFRLCRTHFSLIVFQNMG